MSKYLPGDCVVIREDLRHEYYLTDDDGELIAVPRMVELAGQTITIINVEGDGTYRVKENDYWWCDEMLSGFEYEFKCNEVGEITADEFAGLFG